MIKYVLVSFLSGAAIAAYIVKTYFPAIKTKTEQVEVVKNNVVTVEKIIRHKDGTVEEVRTVTDKTEKKQETSKIETHNPKDQYLVGVSARVSSIADIASPVYGIQAQRRLVGPLFLGLSVDTELQTVVTLSYSF